MDKEKKSKDLVPVKGDGSEKVALTAAFGTLYVKRRNGDLLRPIKGHMTLSEKAGHIYKMRIKKQDKYPITAAGFVHLNKVASVNIVTPQMVAVDGIPVHNPHVDRNPKTKAIETVNVRKIGIGHSPAGNITIIDKTLFYNIYTYFIQSVQAKMNKKKWDKKLQGYGDEPEFPNCAITGTRDERPEGGKWAFFETVEPLGIWVNYEDEAILACLDEHTQRQRFGDRIAQKIVERNILKDHPAIGISQVEATGERGKMTAEVTVYGWRHDEGPDEINNLAKQAEEGSEELDVRADVIDVKPEEEQEAIEETVKEEESPAKANEPPDDFKLKPEEEKK